MPKAINSRALTSEKACINMVFHAPLMHRNLILHDSGHIPSIQKKRQVAVEAIDKTINVRVIQIRIL